MARVKLTKTELKAQTDALKRFQRFLPMLLLKKQQLQSEIAGIAAKAEAVSAKERAVRAELDRWVGLLATDEELLAGLVRVKGVRRGTANIAGVTIPTFESVETEVGEADAWATPAWVDDAVETTKKVVSLRYEREVYEEQRRLVAEELRIHLDGLVHEGKRFLRMRMQETVCLELRAEESSADQAVHVQSVPCLCTDKTEFPCDMRRCLLGGNAFDDRLLSFFAGDPDEHVGQC